MVTSGRPSRWQDFPSRPEPQDEQRGINAGLAAAVQASRVWWHTTTHRTPDTGDEQPPR